MSYTVEEFLRCTVTHLGLQILRRKFLARPRSSEVFVAFDLPLDRLRKRRSFP